ncbi:MAG: DNA helicase RecQ [Victivallales bacterium]|nr:DNA helicase RecQ [Victivallales bacterium]
MMTATLEYHLKRIFGYTQFRPNQREIVGQLLAGHDVFAVMPTGGGKSLCYQLPAAITPGTGVVISPLISLMKDQVDGARDLGIRAEYLNSNLTPAAMSDVYRMLEQGELDLLYVSPERFAMDGFLTTLSRTPINLFAVDEAHCMSEWGHDFRPDYLNLTAIRQRFPAVPIAAFTATATRKVQDDIAGRLQLRDPFLVRASFNRPNLYYRVEPKGKIREQLLDFVEQHRDVAGIIYRTSRKDVDATADFLRCHGIKALPYHAGLSREERERNQDAFNRDEINVIVATIAFGMGIDKSNVRYVVHGDLPKNLEGYYQETGRAGRDGDPSLCVLFFGRGDIVKLRYFIDRIEDAGERDIARKKLYGVADFADQPVCRRRQLLAYFGEDYPAANCGGCDVCVGEVEKADESRSAQMLMSAVARVRAAFPADHIIDIVIGNDTAAVRHCRHHDLPTFGVGREHDRDYWHALLQLLRERDCLRTDSDPAGGIVLTAKGKKVLFGHEKFLILRPAPGKKRARRAPVETAAAGNHDLFERLRQLRRRLADDADVPPYVIFSDKVLTEMSRALPQRQREMGRISGVGEAKLRKYGAVFIEEIRQFLEEHPDVLPAGRLPIMPARSRSVPSRSAVNDGALAQLMTDGLALTEIAETLRTPLRTLTRRLEAMLDQGRELPLDSLVGTAARLEIERQIALSGRHESVTALARQLGGTFDPAVIRLVKKALPAVVPLR